MGKRPWHLWVVGIVAFLWGAMGAFDYLMTETQNEAYLAKFTPEQLDFFLGLPAWFVAIWAIAVWCGLLGGLLLLLRRKLAFEAYLVSFLAMLITTIYSYGFTKGYEIMGGAGPLLFSVAIFVIALLLVVYARAMRGRGVLV